MTSIRFPVLFTLVLALFSGGPPAAQADDVTSLLSFESEGVYYLNVGQALNCDLFKKYLAESLKAEVTDKEVYKQTVQEIGFDPLRDVKTIVAFAAVPKKKDDVLASHAAVRHDRKVRCEKTDKGIHTKAAETNSKIEVVREKDRDLFKVSFDTQAGKQDIFIAVIDEKRVVMGLKPDVLAAFELAAGKAQSFAGNKEIIKVLAAIDPNSVLYVYNPSGYSNFKDFTGFDDPAVTKWAQSLAADPATVKLLAKITTLRSDIRIASDVKVKLMLEVSDADTAKELKPLFVKGTEQVKGFVNLIILAQPLAKSWPR